MTKNTSVQGQIPLNLSTGVKPEFELYVPGKNCEACEAVQQTAKGEHNHTIYLWGTSGTGKSHLLQAACICAAEFNRRVAYIPLSNHAELNPQLLDDLDNMDLVCVDDIDAIAGQREWEQPVLHLYNRLRDKSCAMLITGQSGTKNLPFDLDDLKTRLVWDLVYHLSALGDEDKIKALQIRASKLEFSLPDEVAEYLVRRVQRDLSNLFTLLEKLEECMLVEKRKLTIPFVRTILEKNKKAT